MSIIKSSKNIFEGLGMVYYSNPTIFDSYPENGKLLEKAIKFSKPFYKLFVKPMPTL